MKKLLLFLFIISFHSYAQDTIPAAKSVVALDKMNVVYRGVPNPISIAVNNAKSYVISGKGVSKKDDGKYVIYPGSGNETKVFVEIENFDGSKVIEEHVFRIKGLPAPIGTLNGQYSTNGILFFSLKELEEAEVSFKFIDFLFPIDLNVTHFSIKVSNYPIVNIDGNKITSDVFNLLKKARKNDLIVISHIRAKYMEGDGCHRSIGPIIFQIIK
jgi:hypothetical protein